LFIHKISTVKQFRFLLMPVVILVWLWPAESGAARPLILRVQQSLVIQSIGRPGYRLQGAQATLAQRGDRLEHLASGIQTGDGAIVLALDTQAGWLKLSPHSRCRITQIDRRTDGSRWFYVTIEQGQAQLIPAGESGKSADPGAAQPLGAVRAAIAAIAAIGWHG
jgi:hypothetical protein